MELKSINIEIIDICNLSCNICDIWKNKDKNIISEDDIKSILFSKYLKKETDISITWWEPMLHKDINKLFFEVKRLWFKINTISTNWTIYNKLEELLTFCYKENIDFPNIHISIDWLEKNHDKQRGKTWAFKKSLETIMKLKNKFRNINIKLKYTITKSNIEDIEKVYVLSKKLWVNISFKIVENDENYTNTIKKPSLLNKKDKEEIIKILEKIYKDKDLYVNNLLYYIKNNKFEFDCQTPINNLFIMSNWDTYVCTKYEKIWNIKKENIDNIIWNKIHDNITKKVKRIKCNKCFSLHWAYKTII